MQITETIQLMVLAAAIVWQSGSDAAASTAVKLCGRKLSEIMSRVCHAYNSPAWDDPRVVEQPASVKRRKREAAGIADECCTYGCTWSQLNEYCAISANTESPLEALEAHMIENRSVEDQSRTPGTQREMMSPSSVGRRSEDLLKNAVRAAPVVGTVSPLLTWGRTLNTDLPPAERDRYAYIAVYT